METPNSNPTLKSKLIERLHEPLPLRVVLCLVLLVIWYYAGYKQMGARIAATTIQLELDRKRLALASEVEGLRGDEAEFVDRLPPRSDPNEFLQYVLAGVRSGPLKLLSLTPDKAKDAFPFEVAAVRLELEGKFLDVEDFLNWVETDKRLLRVDVLSMNPDNRERGLLRVQLNVIGLMGVEASEKSESASKGSPSKSKASAPKAKGSAPKSKASAPASSKPRDTASKPADPARTTADP
jgi:hypothetical protein